MNDNNSDAERFTGECDATDCGHMFVNASFEEVVDHILSEHGQYVGDVGDLQAMTVFDFAMSAEQIEYLYERTRDSENER